LCPILNSKRDQRNTLSARTNTIVSIFYTLQTYLTIFEMSYDPIHDKLDAFCHWIGGDKKAFERLRKRNDRTRELRNTKHKDNGMAYGREGVGELERRLRERQGDPKMIPQQHPNPAQYSPPRNTDPIMTSRQHPTGISGIYPPQYRPISVQHVPGERNLEPNLSSGELLPNVESHRPLLWGLPQNRPGISTRSLHSGSRVEPSKMPVGDMTRTFIEGYEIPSERTSTRSLRSSSRVEPSRMPVGDMTRTYIEGYEIPSELHRR
jgi:hypothetical protein